ncbi:twin-arginine translocase TatA/TatE family subunit [Halobacteriaceae archaeon GCM10025711]
MAVELTPLFAPGLPGGMELAVILLIAILLFGANKIPKLARSTGQAMGEFQKGREEVEQELQEMKTKPKTTTDSDESTASSETQTEAEAETETETESASGSDTKSEE